MRIILAGICLSAVMFILVAGTIALTYPSGDAMPVGTIIAWAGERDSIPPGWKPCMGQLLNRERYPELFAAIGTAWGSTSPDGFNLPDLRGRFLRGVDAGTGRDPEADDRIASRPGGNTVGVGSMQDDSIQNHTHLDSGHDHGYTHFHSEVIMVSMQSSDAQALHSWSGAPAVSGNASLHGAARYRTESDIRAGEESRPKNAAVYYIIKVR
jgi:microcystin-dependent protein